MNRPIHDHGQGDPLPFEKDTELAKHIRRHLPRQRVAQEDPCEQARRETEQFLLDAGVA